MPQIHNAITRQRKEQTVAQLEELLTGSTVVVGLRYQGLTVKQLQDFRRSLPAESTMLVCKNTLMRRACEKVEGWSELTPATKGDNAWLFVNEEVRLGGGACGWLTGGHGAWGQVGPAFEASGKLRTPLGLLAWLTTPAPALAPTLAPCRSSPRVSRRTLTLRRSWCWRCPRMSVRMLAPWTSGGGGVRVCGV